MTEEVHLHGVLIKMNDSGVFITGDAGVGKSSLALELLYQGHTLIADDNVTFYKQKNKIIGHCPSVLEELLHTRELGLISVSTLFGEQAWQQKHALDLIVEITEKSSDAIQLILDKKTRSILGRPIPLLTLSLYNPASLVHRIQCYLSMQQHPSHHPEKIMSRRQ